MARKKRCGIGAVCSCLVNKLHPGLEIEAKFPNRSKQDRLGRLLAIKREPRTVNWKEQVCIVFRHDSFANKELHAVERWVKVDEEGASEHFFGGDMAPGGEEGGEEGDQGGGEEFPQQILRARACVEDIAMVRNMGFTVDDDNEPAPENIPTVVGTPAAATEVHDGQNWGWQGLDHRKRQGCHDTNASVKGMNSTNFFMCTYLKFFFLFFPRQFIENVFLLRQTKTSRARK